MKLTWLGGTALRVHIGGQIIVCDPDAAGPGVNAAELVSGADRIVRLGNPVLPLVDAAAWRPVPTPRAIDGEPEPPEILTIGGDTVLMAAAGERPLLVSNTAELPRLGRWADNAVILLFGERGANLAEAIVKLDLARPQPLVLAADEATADQFLGRIADDLRATSFVSLEPGMALEV